MDNLTPPTTQTSIPGRSVAHPCGLCGELSGESRCPAHRRRDPRTTTERGYGSDWRKLRRAKLAANPVCELQIECAGAVAREVHHVETIEDRPDLRLDWNNLKSTCLACHGAVRKGKA